MDSSAPPSQRPPAEAAETPAIPSGELAQRNFYGMDDATFERITRTILEEELSVVDGGILEEFETRVADFFDARHAVATTNGTASLHLALFALDIGPGDEVIVPTLGYYATALPVCMMGATPVFCDIEEETLAIDPADAARMVTPRTKAIIVLQPWGLPADVDTLRALADEHGLALISDSSHALGARWDGAALGRSYDIVCASMGKGKLISGGEVGIVTANDDRLRDRMVLYGHVNRVPRGLITDEYRHLQNAVGMKYRPHPFTMALALEQMSTYGERSARLVKNIQRFEAGLAEIPFFEPFAVPAKAERVYWRVPVHFDTEHFPELADLQKALVELGSPVDTRSRERLIHEHNVISEYYGVETNRSFPVAERLRGKVLYLEAFSFYDEAVIEPMLDHFAAVARR